jgi:hypothetical protein
LYRKLVKTSPQGAATIFTISPSTVLADLSFMTSAAMTLPATT